MREKILLQLIAMCKDLTGVSEKTLGVYATEMAKTVTEESQIEAAVLAQKPILESFQGNLRFNEKKAVDNHIEKNPPATPPASETETEKAVRLEKERLAKKGETLTAEDISKIVAEQVTAAMKPLTEKLQGSEKAKALDAMKSETAQFIAKTYGSFNENEKYRSDMAFANILLKNPEIENAEKMHEAWKAEFDVISSGLGFSALTPADSIAEDGKVSTELSDFKKKMIEKGNLPEETK